MRAPRRATWLFVLAVALAAVLSSLPRGALAFDRNFAGSAQLDYHFAPTAKRARSFPDAFDGFTMELAGKVAVDFSDKVSANLKVCYGCHGFEADMMYFDFRVADELNFRVGRFSPTFGAFNLRHDPANHRLSDKPLAYDMGRMLRMRQWNLGVMPSPFPDNGVEINGTRRLGAIAQLDYAVYAVSGFKADAGALDLDFKLSRSPQSYYVDNNARPAGGARVAVTLKLGEVSDLTLGASGMYGTFDPDNRLSYAIAGADATLRLETTTVRVEGLSRRQEMDTSDPSRFKYVLSDKRGDFFMKHGAYVEVEQAVTRELDLIARADGLLRVGNVAADSELSSRATVLRYTLGLAYAIERGLRVKFSTEAWDFGERDALTNRKFELGMHAALAGSF